MRAADTCEFGLKQVRFSSLASAIHVELSHGMQCSTLAAAVLPFELFKLIKLSASPTTAVKLLHPARSPVIEEERLGQKTTHAIVAFVA